MKRMVCVLILLLLLSGCDTYGMMNLYPNYKADVWYCEEIEATIDFTSEEYATNTVLHWNGEAYYCSPAWAGKQVVFLFDINGDGGIALPEEALFEGRWKYKNQKLVIEIISSNLFGDAFSELTFIPVYEE